MSEMPMQNELKAAGERIREIAQKYAQMEAGEAEQRGLAQQAQQDASRLQVKVQSFSEVVAQRDFDLQVSPSTSHSLNTTELTDGGNMLAVCSRDFLPAVLSILALEPHLGRNANAHTTIVSLLRTSRTAMGYSQRWLVSDVCKQSVSLHAVCISVGHRITESAGPSSRG